MMAGRVFDPNSTMDREQLKQYLEHGLKIERENGRLVIKHAYSSHPDLTAMFFQTQGYAVRESFKALVEHADRDIYVALG